MKDLMIDLETLGTTPGSIILSIGACFFDRNTSEIGEVFYTEINTQSCKDAGLTASADTIAWWERQSGDAKALLERCRSSNSLSALETAKQFIEWVNKQSFGSFTSVWANDPTFDCKLLEALLATCGESTPWPFWQERSCRTAVEIGLAMGINPKKEIPFTGIQHNALDDAKHQAEYVSAVFQQINNLKA